jgi:hypothetical protein
MRRRSNHQLLAEQCNDPDDAYDLDALLHPAQAFDHPSDVVSDPDLTLNEKRAILASWASDACAIEAAPSLRCIPGGKQPVRFDDVMEALRALDSEARREQGSRRSRRRSLQRVGRPSPGRSNPDTGQGHSLN